MTGDERIEHLPDLKERHAGLLMASDPQGDAFAKRDRRTARRPLPFYSEEALLLDADDIGERSLPIFEYRLTRLLPVVDAGTATMNGVRGLLTGTTLMLCTLVATGRYF